MTTSQLGGSRGRRSPAVHLRPRAPVGAAICVMVSAMEEAIGIYIHIPFCAAHCAYCHFVIDLSRGDIQQRYVDALLKEIEYWGSRISAGALQQVDSIYVGGGTPSWINSDLIRRVVDALRRNFSIDPEAEATIEANPDSLSEQKADEYLRSGFNRVSLGIQSFRNDELKRLGRTHTAEEAEDALRRLRRAGFENISIDLMAALPGQTADHWKENFKHVEQLHPEHVSLYLFDVDEGRALGRRVLTAQGSKSADRSSSPLESASKFSSLLPPEDEVIRIYELALSELDRLGYGQYEISNFAKRPASLGQADLFQSRHNLKYWNMQPYLGLGCAAHSFLPPHRWRNANSTEEYIRGVVRKGQALRDEELMSAARNAEDAFIFGLRQTSGIHYDVLSQRLGCDARGIFRPVIEPLVEDGWLVEDGGRLRLAPHAVLVSNEIFERFLSAES